MDKAKRKVSLPTSGNKQVPKSEAVDIRNPPGRHHEPRNQYGSRASTSSDSTFPMEDDHVTDLSHTDDEVFSTSGSPAGTKKEEKSQNFLKRLWSRSIRQKKGKCRRRSEADLTAMVKHINLNDNQELKVEVSSFYPQVDPRSEYGQGALIIVTQFTGCLQGYTIDAQRIRQTFENMGYKIFEAEPNITQRELFVFLKKVALDIQKSEVGFDRLVCAIMSHGLQGGIMTCKDKQGYEEEEEEDESTDHDMQDGASTTTSSKKPLLTKIEDIINVFKHHRLKKLKDKPKLFLIQACKGGNVVKAASKVKRNSVDESGRSAAVPDLQPPTAPSPVDADIAICYACTDENMSFVDDNRGSWLIESFCDVCDQSKSTAHVEDLLTKVKDLVANRRKKFERGDAVAPGVVVRETAIQMPCTSSTLRKQFWLVNKVEPIRVDRDNSSPQIKTRSRHSSEVRHPPLHHRASCPGNICPCCEQPRVQIHHGSPSGVCAAGPISIPHSSPGYHTANHTFDFASQELHVRRLNRINSQPVTICHNANVPVKIPLPTGGTIDGAWIWNNGTWQLVYPVQMVDNMNYDGAYPHSTPPVHFE